MNLQITILMNCLSNVIKWKNYPFILVLDIPLIKNSARKFIATGGTVTPFGTSFTIWIMSKIFSSTKLSQTTQRINETAK